MRSDRAFRTCVWCGHAVHMNKNGSLRAHRREIGYDYRSRPLMARCAGSGTTASDLLAAVGGSNCDLLDAMK